MAVTALIALAVLLTTQSASAEQLAPGRISLSDVGSWLSSLFSGAPHWGGIPEQEQGTAAGHGHKASAASTHAKGGSGHRPGTAPGELAAYTPHAEKVVSGPSAPVPTGFDPATSTRNAAKSTATMTYFDNADGSATRQYTRDPVNYTNAPGSWVPIDNTLHAGADGRWHDGANSLKVDFAPSAGDAALASFGVDGSHSVAYTLQGATGVTPQVSGETAAYHGILPGTDVELAPTSTGLKESIVLHSAGSGNSWVFPLKLTGLTPALATDGSVNLSDAAGKVVERVPRGYAFDSHVDQVSGDPTTTYGVTYALTTADGVPALKVTLDAGWLADPARVFPVTVDPTFNDVPASTYAEQTAPVADHSMEKTVKIGSWNSGPDSANSFLAFPKDLDGSGVQVTAATLNLFDTWASICDPERLDVAPVTQAWTPQGVTSWPGPSFGASIGNATPSVPHACANKAADRAVGDWVAVPLSTSTFTAWANGSAVDNGLAVYAATNDAKHWKQFDSSLMGTLQPTLSLTTSGNVPPQIDSTYPANGGVATTLTPFLFANGHDLDQSPSATLQYRYQVADTNGTTVADSGILTTHGNTWRIPAGKIKYGQTYYWAVQSYDGDSYSPPPAWSSLAVQVPQPLITSSLSQNSGTHGFDPSIGNYTTSATDAEVQTAGPSLSVVRDYNSRDPRSTGAFGAGWSSVFDAKAVEQYSFDGSGAVVSVLVTYPDGSEVGFGKNDDGTFAPPSGRFATFKSITGGYSLTDKNDTVYTFSQGLGAGGFGLTSIADAGGRALNFTSAAGQVSAATSGVSGRALHLTWSTPPGATSAHVQSVASDQVTPGVPASAPTWTYGYNGDQLTSACPPGTTTACTQYSYTSGSQYQTKLLDLGPHSFWPLAESSGTTAASAVLANEGADAATYSNVALGQPGPLAGSSATSAGFNGTSSYVKLPSGAATGPDAMSMSMWFKTTATNGVLFSYSNFPVTDGTTPQNYTPALYVGNDGKLVSEYWIGDATKAMVTPAAVNDGTWHHVVMTHSSESQGMYLDGVFVGSLLGAVSPIGQANRYIGAGFLGGGWPDEANAGKVGTAAYFNGSIADVGFFDKPVPGVEEAGLYASGKHAASLLSTIVRPSGSTHTTVSYDPVSGAVTKVGDENGGTWTLAPPTVAGSSQVYRAAVLGGQPVLYDRLGDNAGTAQPADEVNYRPSTYSGVTLGVPGPFSDATGASFNGTSSGITLPSGLLSATTTSSVELWFNTTSTTAGTLFSTGNSALGTANPSGGAMPVMYVGSDGKLYGHFWNNSVTGMVSTAKVNDGKWHQALLTGAGTTQTLYLDGQSVGTIAGQLGNYDPLTLVGAGVYNNNGWPAAPAGNTWNYFKGSISDVAYYHSALSAGDASEHFVAAGNSQGLAPMTVVKVTDPGNATTTYQSDPLNGNRRIAEIDGAGARTSYGYDTAGFAHTVTDANGNVTTTGHDVRGNTVSQTACQNQAAGTCATAYYSYFPDDTTAQLTTADARNDLMLTVRDGRSSSATDPAYLTTYTYDPAGDRTAVTTPPVPGFPGGRTTKITYSDGTATYPAADSGNTPPGMPVKTGSPGGAVNVVSYFHNGDVASTTNADGLVTKFGYDPLGRVTGKTVVSDSFPAGLTTSYVYDPRDQITSQTDPPVTDRITGAIHTAVTTTAYNANGSVTSQSISDATGGDASRTNTSTFNDLDQLKTSTDANNNTTTYAYDVYGNKKSETDANGTETDWTYDPDGHILTQGIVYTGSPVDPKPATFLTTESRSYDPSGRVATVTDSMGNVTTYTYYDSGQLATATRTDPAGHNPYVEEADSYDAAGNPTTKVTNNGATTTVDTVDAANRTAVTTVDPTGVNRTTTVSYTPDDKAATTTLTDSTGQTRTTTASYDPMGNMTSKSASADGTGHPVGWWKLDQSGGSTVTDSSGTGNTASAQNVAFSGGAATFNGTNSEIATNGPVLNTAGSFSVSAWVNPTTLPNWTTFVIQKSVNTSGLFLEYDGSTHKWAFSRTSSDGASPATYRAESANPAQTGVWTHLTAVFDSSTGLMTLYVNGVASGSTTDPAPLASNGPVIIGHGYAGANGNYVNGQIGDVQAYSRALSGSDVSTLYSGGRSGGTVASSAVNSTSWALDKRGLPTSQTDPDGNVTSYSYDEAGQAAVTTAPVVNAEVGGGTPVAVHPVSTTGFNTFGDPVERQDPNGNQTTAVYDAEGQAVSVTQPNYVQPGTTTPITATVVSAYDKLGKLVSRTDPKQNTSRYLYDQLGNLVQTTLPGGGKTVTTYDTNGDKLAVTDPVGAQSQATYDFLGRQLTASTLERYPAPVTATTTNSYAASASNPGGAFLASTTSPNGAVTAYGTDHVGQTTSVTDAAGNTTRYGYNLLGDKQVTTLPDNSTSTVSYDSLENPVQVQQKSPLATLLSQTSAVYDGDGRLLSSTDARSNTSTFTYDAVGRLTQEVQPVTATSSITASFGYDAVGNRTRFTDGRGNSTLSTFNSWNKQESTIEPKTATYTADADRTFTSVYDADGLPTAQVQPGGVTIAASYDVDGNLLTQSGNGAEGQTATRTFGYDLAGRMKTASTAAAGTAGAAGSQAATDEAFTYNDRGALLTAAGAAGSSSFGYNNDGLMTSRTDAAGTSSYGYDGADRLSTMTDAATGVQQGLSYNSMNQVSQIQYGASGNVRTFGYDQLHNLASDTLTTNAKAAIASINYGYDTNGNLTSKTTAGFAGASSNTYTYDESNRLTQWNNGTTATNYSYDASGNRTQVGANVYTYDARDQLTSDGVNSYSYTARGTLSQQVSAKGAVTVQSDAYGQMTLQGSQGYSYDALSRNITDTATAAGGGATTAFSYSGQGNTAASDGVNTYSRDPDGTVAGIGTAADGGGTAAGTGVFAYTDQHSDVVGDFSATGASLSGSTSYDPLGNVTATTTQAGKLGYQSGWTDKATGNVNMAARWYNPAIGQFMNRDTVSNSPVPNSAEANPFAYVDDNPMLGQDPSGHGWFDDLTSVVSSAWHATTNFVQQNIVQPVEHLAVAAYNWTNQHIIQPVVHVVRVVAHHVVDAYRRVVRVVRNVYHRVVRVVRKVVHAAVHLVKTAYHAVAKVVKSAAHVVVQAAKTAAAHVATAAKAVGKFVQAHSAVIATIASTVVGIAAFAVCTGATWGVGVVGCAALAGAASNAVSYGITCSGQPGGCSAGGALEAIGLGAATGALGGALAGPLGGKLVSSALEGVMPEVAIQGLVGAGSGAVTGGVAGAADYGLHCSGSADGCSVRGAAGAAGGGALAGGLAGGVLGAAGGLRGRGRAGSEEESSSCSIAHSFVGGTAVLMADGSSKPISAVQVGDQVSNSVPGEKTLQTHKVEKVIVTATDHDFVDVTVKAGVAGRVRAAAAKVAAGAAIAATVLVGGAGVAAAAPADAASTVTTTFHHPFYDVTQSAFVEAVDLHAGDELQTADGGTATITQVRPYHTTELTYDLTIDGLHTYYVDAGTTPILVHNHSCEVSVHDTSGNVRDSYDVQSGNMTPEEAELGGGYNSQAATHTENRVGRMSGASSGRNPIPNDPFAGLHPVSPGETVHLAGELPPCPRCQGAMNRMVNELGVNVVYTFDGSRGSGTWVRTAR